MFKCVSKDIPNHDQLKKQLWQIATVLEYEKQAKFDEVLNSLGLELVNGVVVQKGDTK